MKRPRNRRAFLASAAGLAAAASLPTGVHAQATVNMLRGTEKDMLAAIARVTGSKPAQKGRVKLEVPPLVDNGKRVFENGHTFYFRRATEKPAFFKTKNPAFDVAAVWEDFVRGMYSDVETGRFDCILANSWDLNGIFTANPPPGSTLDGLTFMQQFYRLRETVPVTMPNRPGGGKWDIQVWVPKNRPGACVGESGRLTQLAPPATS